MPAPDPLAPRAPDRAAPLLPQVCPVVDRHRETTDTVTLTLDVRGTGLGAPGPGQFTMLYAFGIGEVPISLSAVADGVWQQTIRAVGAVTDALTSTAVGAHVGVRGPYGRGWPLDACRGGDLLVVGGGLGLAPLRPVVHAVLADRAAFGRVALLVGARSPDVLLFRDELDAWQHRGDLDVTVTVDHAGTEWPGAVGVVTSLVPRAVADPSQTSALVCGPEVMMRYTAATLEQCGVPPGRTHLSLERAMRCGEGHCGRCQLGTVLLCRDGPVVAADAAAPLLGVGSW